MTDDFHQDKLDLNFDTANTIERARDSRATEDHRLRFLSDSIFRQLQQFLSAEEILFYDGLLSSMPLQLKQELRQLLSTESTLVDLLTAITNTRQTNIQILSNNFVNQRIKESSIKQHLIKRYRLMSLSGMEFELDDGQYDWISRLTELQLFFLEHLTLSAEANLVNLSNLGSILNIAKWDNPISLSFRARGMLFRLNPIAIHEHLRNGLLSELSSRSPDEQIEYLQMVVSWGARGLEFSKPSQNACALLSKMLHITIFRILENSVTINESFSEYIKALEVIDSLEKHQNMEEVLFQQNGLLNDLRELVAFSVGEWLFISLFNYWLEKTFIPFDDEAFVLRDKIISELEAMISPSATSTRRLISELTNTDLSQIFYNDDLELIFSELNNIINFPCDIYELNEMLSNVEQKKQFAKFIFDYTYEWIIKNRESVIKSVNYYLLTFIRVIQYFSVNNFEKDVNVLVNYPLAWDGGSGYADIIIQPTEQSNSVTLIEIKAPFLEFAPKSPKLAALRQVCNYLKGLKQEDLIVAKVMIVYATVREIKIFEMSEEECFRQLEKAKSKTNIQKEEA